jgi:ribosomal protein S27E
MPTLTIHEVTVSCPKCSGFLVFEQIYDDGIWVDYLRCVNCGEVIFKPEPGLGVYRRHLKERRAL